MDWQTVLRAAVPFGAALLAVVALLGSWRDRKAVEAPGGDQGSATGPGGSMARTRGAPGQAAGAAPSRAPRTALLRAAAAVLLLLLVGATALVFVSSRPLADVEIVSASTVLTPCPPSQICSRVGTLTVRGTVGEAGSSAAAVVRVLIRPAPGSDWTAVAEVRPAESGEWSVDGVPLPTSTGEQVDVRAVVERDGGPLVSARDRYSRGFEALARSRVVQVPGKSGGNRESPTVSAPR